MTKANQRIGIVAARFNQVVTEKLVNGAVQTLKQAGIPATAITVIWVPGALELARTARLLGDSGQVDGIIAVGAVIRGETSHYDAVCAETTRGLGQVSLTGPVPVLFGVLTTDDLYQALNRAGGKAGNKGSECATGVLEMLAVQTQLIK